MYDQIAMLYHLVYPDWNAAIAQQATALDAIIRKHVGPPPRAILDVSCGIGTQALGLAVRGHAVTASDLSSAAVERARREAAQRNLAIDFTVADMRRCAEVHGSGFDVVLSADNSIPHLLSDDAIRQAFDNFRQCIRPGGITILGVRAYLTEGRSSPQLVPYGFRSDGDDRYFVVQTRDGDGDFYDVAMYFIREGRGSRPATVISGSSRYYAVPIDPASIGCAPWDGLTSAASSRCSKSGAAEWPGMHKNPEAARARSSSSRCEAHGRTPTAVFMSVWISVCERARL
jgi:SAM-dependent methyltransferase